MGHHALERRAAVMQHAGDVDQLRVVGLDAGAVAVAVDLDHHVEGVAFRLSSGDDRGCRRHRVHQDRQGASPATQGQRPVELLRRDAHRVQHVGEARREELLGFLQRRHGNPAGAGVPLPSSDLDALRGLDVRTQADAERIHALLHARDIAHHARFVDQRGGSGNVRRMQGNAFNQDIPRAPAVPGHRAPVRPRSAPIPCRESADRASGRSTPTASICRLKPGSATAMRSASLRRLMIGAGVPLGANKAFHARMFTSPIPIACRGRDIGQLRQSAIRQDRERPDLAAGNLCQRSGRLVAHDVDMSAHQVVHCRSDTPIGHVGDVLFERRQQAHASEVRDRADAGAPIGGSARGWRPHKRRIPPDWTPAAAASPPVSSARCRQAPLASKSASGS